MARMADVTEARRPMRRFAAALAILFVALAIALPVSLPQTRARRLRGRLGASLAWFAGGRAILDRLLLGAGVTLHHRSRRWSGFPWGDGVELLIWLFLVVWATDIGGWRWGGALQGPNRRRHQSEQTWSGAIGGDDGGGSSGGGLGPVWGTRMTFRLALLSGGKRGLCCWSLGDLAESAWKRRFEVKDQGLSYPDTAAS